MEALRFLKVQHASAHHGISMIGLFYLADRYGIQLYFWLVGPKMVVQLVGKGPLVFLRLLLYWCFISYSLAASPRLIVQFFEQYLIFSKEREPYEI